MTTIKKKRVLQVSSDEETLDIPQKNRLVSRRYKWSSAFFPLDPWMECSTYLLLPVAASSAHTWPWFTSVSLTFTEYSRLVLATKDNVSLLVKMEFCRQPIYRIKGCQYFWVRHKGLLILLGKRWKRMFLENRFDVTRDLEGMHQR